MHDIYDIGHTSQLGTKGTIAKNRSGNDMHDRHDKWNL